MFVTLTAVEAEVTVGPELKVDLAAALEVCEIELLPELEVKPEPCDGIVGDLPMTMAQIGRYSHTREKVGTKFLRSQDTRHLDVIASG
jgi:hypothetical protein